MVEFAIFKDRLPPPSGEKIMTTNSTYEWREIGKHTKVASVIAAGRV
jgi:hypothetical protein